VSTALGESDARELLRIALVYAREWVRSGRRPPGSPHRPSLLAPSASWLRLRTGEITRQALRLACDRPLWQALAGLAVEIVSTEPALDLERLNAARFEGLMLGTPEPLATPPLTGPSRRHLAVEQAGRCALVPADDATEAGWTVDDHLCACCRIAGLDEQAWRAPDAKLYAFETPLFTS
jgi:AMMECR1 domain-containing protein